MYTDNLEVPYENDRPYFATIGHTQSNFQCSVHGSNVRNAEGDSNYNYGRVNRHNSIFFHQFSVNAYSALGVAGALEPMAAILG